MRREEFLNSIKVDQATIDKCNQAGRDFNVRNENGQYAVGNNQRESAYTTGFDRDGDFGGSETTKTGAENGPNNTVNNEIGVTADNEESLGIEGAIGSEENVEIEGAVNNDIDSGIDGGIDM